MGNQLSGIAPSQILPVEHYLTDVAEYEYDASLGSTRFFKVAKARFKEGLSVVKVFVIHDPSLPLKNYQDHLEELRVSLQGASNCLPFQRATLSDKAALLFRQYVKDSLYDRISTRPFLNAIEKRWLAFQLLCALNQCHKLNVCHGDIKSENVMVTSWNWLLLVDFASFKPTYLPEDNPADFSYFFDTSRRRTCYIAPERFVESSAKNTDQTSAVVDLTNSEVKKGDLTPAMDIFSAGCVIAELFTEGTAPFDLSQLLAYRGGDYSPWKVVEKIEDTHVRELVRHMLQRDPALRLSAEEYLIQQRGKAFPEYFYTFLKLYLQRFAGTPIMPADDRITRLKRDMKLVVQNLNIDNEMPSENNVLVIIISLITASLRSLHYCSSKLISLELLLQLSGHVTADIILDRLLPFMLHLVTDESPRVRAEALRTVTQCLSAVKSVPISDANIFPEYILPQLSPLTQDPAVMVRVTYAENIASLAETALRFLEIVQLTSARDSQTSDKDTSQYQVSYDVELQALQEMIQQKVVTLLSDQDNIVKQTMLAQGITRLCVFFGRQKANDVLLSHVITFLNDKYDWHLRGAFYDNIVGVAAYVGWQSSAILKPLLEQGLCDAEEFVIYKSLCALMSLTQLGLLQKAMLHEFMAIVAPFLCHPNVWVRHGAVGFVAAVAKTLNIADVHCNLLPLIQPFLKLDVIQLDEIVLLNALQEPIPRQIYDYILRSQHIQKLFDNLQDRQLLRNICRSGHRPNYRSLEDNLAQVLRKLLSQGMTEADEDKLLLLKDSMLKLHHSRAGSVELSTNNNKSEEDSSSCGMLDLTILGRSITRRHADLVKPDLRPETNITPTKKSARKKAAANVESPTVSMNEDWKQMFASTIPEKPAVPNKPSKLSQDAMPAPTKAPSSGNSQTSLSAVTVSISDVQSSVESSKKASSVSPSGTQERPSMQLRLSQCKIELRNLVYKKRDQFASEQQSRDILDSATWESRPPPANWKPSGQLVAHLHEHRGAVNRLKVSHDHQYFATCSNDGTVKIWDCSRMEGKSVTNRSRQTYNKQGGQIKTLTFCENSYSVASASDSGAIHVFRIETGSPQISILHTRNLDIDGEGQVVDINHFDTGSQSVLTYATVHGLLVGWDLRSSRIAWKLKNDPKLGLITSFDVHHSQSWLAVGTSSGSHVCWDMRFQLPITSLTHPTGARVRRSVCYPAHQSWVVSAVQGNNEVSMWDMETGARQKTLWASTVPALSQTQASNHSINGVYVGITDSNAFLLTGGSDMRVRYWDLSYPANSHIVAPSASDPVNQTVVSYRSRLIDGTEVIQEMYSKPRNAVNEDAPRRGPEAPPVGHHDVISDIALCQSAQCLILTCSREGVVKVWK